MAWEIAMPLSIVGSVVCFVPRVFASTMRLDQRFEWP